MSRGLGWVQRECLLAIKRYEVIGKRPTTFAIAAEIYRVDCDEDGNRWVNDAQHVATKRALAGLRRKGLVSGQQEIFVSRDGTKHLALHNGWTAERCCLWSSAQ